MVIGNTGCTSALQNSCGSVNKLQAGPKNCSPQGQTQQKSSGCGGGFPTNIKDKFNCSNDLKNAGESACPGKNMGSLLKGLNNMNKKAGMKGGFPANGMQMKQPGMKMDLANLLPQENKAEPKSCGMKQDNCGANSSPGSCGTNSSPGGCGTNTSPGTSGANSSPEAGGTEGKQAAGNTENQGDGAQPTPEEMQLFNMVNAERQKKGLEPLEFDQAAYKAAKGHSNDMSQNSFMGHESSDGKNVQNRLQDAGAQMNSGAAENVAAGGDSETMLNNWMNSEGHSQNILNPQFKKGAIAITNGKATQTFTG